MAKVWKSISSDSVIKSWIALNPHKMGYETLVDELFGGDDFELGIGIGLT